MIPPRRPPLSPEAERELLLKARAGDMRALSVLLATHEAAARRALRFLIGEPEDVNDLMQEALMDAYAQMGEHDDGMPFARWLQHLAVRQATNFLALKKRWRAAAQIHVQLACAEADVSGDVMQAMIEPEFEYSIGDHLAFCFAGRARSLSMEQQFAVVLVDVLDFPVADAARTMRLRDVDLQRYLADGRVALQGLFDRMCGFSRAEAPCDQCRGLRHAAPEGHKGPASDPPGLDAETSEDRRRHRLRVVRAADLDGGPGRALLDLLAGMTTRLEAERETPPERDNELPDGVARWQELQELVN